MAGLLHDPTYLPLAITQASQHILAITFWILDQHPTALRMTSYVMEMRQQVLGHDHPDRMASEEWLELFENSPPSSQYGITGLLSSEHVSVRL
jgi:hypothetical protein